MKKKIGRPKGTTKVKDEDIIKALIDNDGLIYRSARALNCHADTIFTRINKVPAVRDAVEQARGELIDCAESHLKTAIRENEGWAVCFTLKTLGRKRGYVEKFEVDANVNHSGTVTHDHKIDLSRLSDEELETVERIIESATVSV